MVKINKTNRNELSPAEKTKNDLWDFIVLILTSFGITVKVVLLQFLSLFSKLKEKSIANRVVLVTGGGNGFGRALSKRFAYEGCKIAIADIDCDSAEKTVKEIKDQFKVQCAAFRCDISDHSAVVKLKSDVEHAFGPVDILVNNAGLIYGCYFEDCVVADIQRTINVNLTAQIQMTHAFLPSMVARKEGHIVAIASMAAISTFPTATIYCATKWGLDGFMTCLRNETLVNNQEFIQLTTVYPEFIDTRRDLVETVDQVNFTLPLLSPDYAADEVVRGVLRNRSKIFICKFKMPLFIFERLPCATRKYILKTLGMDKMKKFPTN